MEHCVSWCAFMAPEPLPSNVKAPTVSGQAEYWTQQKPSSLRIHAEYLGTEIFSNRKYEIAAGSSYIIVVCLRILSYCWLARWFSSPAAKLKVVNRPVNPVYHWRQPLGGLKLDIDSLST